MKTINTLQDLVGMVGQPVATSDWILVTQEAVNQFAEATGDHQWIHVDVERAKAGPFGGWSGGWIKSERKSGMSRSWLSKNIESAAVNSAFVGMAKQVQDGLEQATAGTRASDSTESSKNGYGLVGQCWPP